MSYTTWARRISSRLEQLLPLGSVVFKERSGYYAYYYRTLLQDRCGGMAPTNHTILGMHTHSYQAIVVRRRLSPHAAQGMCGNSIQRHMSKHSSDEGTDRKETTGTARADMRGMGGTVITVPSCLPCPCTHVVQY